MLGSCIESIQVTDQTMNQRLSRSFLLLLLSVVLLPLPAQAWDGVGHRLSAAVAVQYLDNTTRATLLRILRAHPRYQSDFLDEIPDFVDRNNDTELAQWLLGQAAYWPDMARGLPGAARERYNRPTWHYTDGAWLRGAATMQGNQYIGIAPFPDIEGEDAATVMNEADAHNVVTALDYNARVLTDSSQTDSARAVALCWVLHLAGDIHQPLHTGSLFSAQLFESGDLGGNRIPIGNSNLHAEWDGALRGGGIAENLSRILAQLPARRPAPATAEVADWTVWMQESREILLAGVYTDAMKTAIRQADRRGADELDSQSLSDAYREQMRQQARLRLGLAGLRLAQWFATALPDA